MLISFLLLFFHSLLNTTRTALDSLWMIVKYLPQMSVSCATIDLCYLSKLIAPLSQTQINQWLRRLVGKAALSRLILLLFLLQLPRIAESRTAVWKSTNLGRAGRPYRILPNSLPSSYYFWYLVAGFKRPRWVSNAISLSPARADFGRSSGRQLASELPYRLDRQSIDSHCPCISSSEFRRKVEYFVGHKSVEVPANDIVYTRR